MRHWKIRQLSVPRRALVLSTYQLYLIDIEAKNYPAAIPAMNKSVENLSAEPEYRVSLTKILTALLESDDAKKQLLTLERMDKLAYLGRNWGTGKTYLLRQETDIRQSIAK